jgi:hypothetical protein
MFEVELSRTTPILTSHPTTVPPTPRSLFICHLHILFVALTNLRGPKAPSLRLNPAPKNQKQPTFTSGNISTHGSPWITWRIECSKVTTIINHPKSQCSQSRRSPEGRKRPSKARGVRISYPIPLLFQNQANPSSPAKQSQHL